MANPDQYADFVEFNVSIVPGSLISASLARCCLISTFAVSTAFTTRRKLYSGTAEQIPWLSRFYFGEGGKDGDGIGLQSMVSDRLADIDARAVNTIPIGADADGVEIVARPGRYGPYLQRGEDTASIPPATQETAPPCGTSKIAAKNRSCLRNIQLDISCFLISETGKNPQKPCSTALFRHGHPVLASFLRFLAKFQD